MTLLEFARKNFSDDPLEGIDNQFNITDVLSDGLIEKAKTTSNDFMNLGKRYVNIECERVQNKIQNFIDSIEEDEIDATGEIEIPGELVSYMSNRVFESPYDTLDTDQKLFIKVLVLNVMI